MNKNLSKRIITSFLLLILLSISLLINKYFWLILLLVVSIISFHEFNNLTKKIFKRKKKLIYLLNFISGLYFVIFISTSYDVYSHPPSGLIFIILICIFSDSGGYFIGKLIGGKKLTKISPNKTIAGSIGSFIFSLFPLIIYLLIFLNTNNSGFYPKNLIEIIFLSLFLSLVCQSGDLFISYFKRKAKVEDTGSILPGHGGLLDRIDGAIFVIPAAFIIDKLFFYI